MSSFHFRSIHSCIPSQEANFKYNQIETKLQGFNLITSLLKQRVSVRKFQKRPVPEEVIRDMLEAARLSPSGGNEQPWMFGVITHCATIKKISRLAHGQKWIASAPLLIVLCTVCVDDVRGGRDIQKHRYPHFSWEISQMPQELYWALNQEEHQTKIPGTHMVLAALEHGLASCWISRFSVMGVAELLKLPDHCLPSEMLAFGYPVLAQEPRHKKSLDELVFWDVFRGQEKSDTEKLP